MRPLRFRSTFVGCLLGAAALAMAGAAEPPTQAPPPAPPEPAAQAPPPPEEPDPQPTFDELFGEEAARVAKTPAVTDDVALARRMLDASDASADRPKLSALLCERAGLLAQRDPGSLDLAVACFERVAAASPERGAELATRSAELRNRQYMAARGDDRKRAAAVYVRAGLEAAGQLEQRAQIEPALTIVRQLARVPAGDAPALRDQVSTRLRQLTAKQLTLNQIDKLKQQLKGDPTDQVAAKKLIELYVVELDEPGEAFKYSMLLTDEKMKANVKAASREPALVEPIDAFDAGQWYRSLAAASREPATRLAMLAHAADLLDRFIDAPDGDGLLIARAKDDREKVAQEIDRIEKAIARETGADWIDLIAKVDWKDPQTTRGFVKRAGVIRCGVGDDRVLSVPGRPAGAYEYRVQLARLSGQGHVGLVFALPNAEGRNCTFVAQGANGNQAGLNFVDGFNYQNNATTSAGLLLPQGRKLTLRVVVIPAGDRVKITAYVGTVAKVRYVGPVSRLTQDAQWSPLAGSMGVLADLTSIAVFAVEYRPLDD